MDAEMEAEQHGVLKAVGTVQVKAREKDEKEKALDFVRDAEPTAWLAASASLVQSARVASEFLFALAASHTEKSPLEKLLTDRFDAEQIWQQIDLQANPILASIRRRLRRLEKTPANSFFLPGKLEGDDAGARAGSVPSGQAKHLAKDSDLEEGKLDLDDGRESGSESGREGAEADDGPDMEEGPNSEEDEYDDYDEEAKNAVEDKFLRLNEMEKFLDQADAEDAGIPALSASDGDADETAARGGDDEDDDNDFDMDDALNFSAQLVGKGQKGETWGPRYSDFVSMGKKQKARTTGGNGGNGDLAESDDEDEEDEIADDVDSDQEPRPSSVQDISDPLQENMLSTHERRQEKIKKRMEQLEKANLDPKAWTLQGEVTASKRPKNSALEVELDFEHGARPAPVITEEVTASLEDIIRGRIIEGLFDDVQRKATLTAAPPRERMELDENKSQKGLGEIYEAEYMQSAGLAAAATPASEALKKEAKSLYKELCLKLDALSHFHFAPKPVMEELEIHTDVPALAMEEVAPMAVSDASMLAPEEVYKGADMVKGEREFTPDERKRRRAQKKRKRKGAKKQEEAKKRARSIDPLKDLNVRHIPNATARSTSSYGKSAKVFAALDTAKASGDRPLKQVEKPRLNASFLKL